MKYHIEFKRVSYVNLSIEAESAYEAEELAWEELLNGDYKENEADWYVNTVEKEEQ